MFESFGEKNKSNQEESKEGINRRKFLKLLAKGGAGVAMYKWGPDVFEYAFEGGNGNLRYEGEELNHDRKEVPAGDLEGVELDSLYCLYIGLSANTHAEESEVVPKRISVDFIQQLTALWNLKQENQEEKNKRNDDRDLSLTPVAIKTGNELIDEYQEVTPNGVSVEEYMDEINRVTADMHDRLDWSNVQAEFNLSDDGRQVLENICNSIGGHELLSYALTELMPSYDGELNKNVLDFMLQHGGREFVERVPAVHDRLTSFGPYQFTSKALYQTPKEERGASQIDEHVSDGSIPGSVSDLRGVDHHQVAYLFAAKNIAELIGRLSQDNLAKFKAGWENHMDDIAKFIATTHNYPYSTEYSNGGLEAGELWIANNMEADFIKSTDHKPKDYARKTGSNYEALE